MTHKRHFAWLQVCGSGLMIYRMVGSNNRLCFPYWHIQCTARQPVLKVRVLRVGNSTVLDLSYWGGLCFAGFHEVPGGVPCLLSSRAGVSSGATIPATSRRGAVRF